MALRCVLERVGRIGYNSHLKTKLGFLSVISTKNHHHRHQNLRPFCHHSSPGLYRLHTEVGEWYFRPPKPESLGFDVDLERDVDPTTVAYGAIVPYRGPLDDPAPTEAARMAVELHNKQQNSNLEFVTVVKANKCVAGRKWYVTFEATDDAGVSYTYQARFYCSFKKKWELEVFRLAP